MEYVAYKLYFKSSVHFGKGTLVDVEPILYADTFFSALCHEALRHGGDVSLNRLVSLAKNDTLVFSDCLPFITEELYIPKPLKPVMKERDGNSSQKKAFKKLSFIPMNRIDEYLAGEIDPLQEVSKLSRLGAFSIKSQAAIRGLDESMPFSVGLYSFNKDNGLYVIIGYEEEEELYFVEGLLQGLSFSGIGGKTSAGYGKFGIQMCNIPSAFERRLKTSSASVKMTVATSMATKDEIEDAVNGAYYLLLKRSGFVSSNTYSDNPMRKRDLYVFKSGSCFTHEFKGDVFDVSSGGRHPVYRYAKPMLIGVD